MRNEYLKTLWLLRFEKIRQGEEDAVCKYQEVLDRCLAEIKLNDEAVQLLKQIIREERMHARLAEELIRLGYRNHPECESLAV